jgi:hypothetical protein
MTKLTREELFVREGVDKETARIAAEASYLLPKQRTPEQQQAISKVSSAICASLYSLRYRPEQSKVSASR